MLLKQAQRLLKLSPMLFFLSPMLWKLSRFWAKIHGFSDFWATTHARGQSAPSFLTFQKYVWQQYFLTTSKKNVHFYGWPWKTFLQKVCFTTQFEHTKTGFRHRANAVAQTHSNTPQTLITLRHRQLPTSSHSALRSSAKKGGRTPLSTCAHQISADLSFTAYLKITFLPFTM